MSILFCESLFEPSDSKHVLIHHQELLLVTFQGIRSHPGMQLRFPLNYKASHDEVRQVLRCNSVLLRRLRPASFQTCLTKSAATFTPAGPAKLASSTHVQPSNPVDPRIGNISLNGIGSVGCKERDSEFTGECVPGEAFQAGSATAVGPLCGGLSLHFHLG